MDFEHMFWTEKRTANFGFSQTVPISLRFETMVNYSMLCYRLTLQPGDDPLIFFSSTLDAGGCFKFSKNAVQFPKNLHEAVKSQSSIVDLAIMPDDCLIMSIRTQQQPELTPGLPYFTALFKRASAAEQAQHMKVMISRLKAELSEERQVANILRAQNEQLIARLRSSEETTSFIQRTLDNLMHSQIEPNNDMEMSPDPEIEVPSLSESLKNNLSTQAMLLPSKDNRDGLLLGIASYLLCAVCEKVSVPAANSTELSQHFIDEHFDDDAKCLVCPDSNVFDLLTHIKMHTHRVYACEFCGKKGRKHYLKSHVRTHTGEKPFKCQTCGRQFADSSTIRRHQTTVHSVGKKFICPICGRDISRKDNYRVHLKSHGGMNPATNKTDRNVKTIPEALEVS